VWKYGRHPISQAEIRRGKKEEERKKQNENIMVCPITYGDHKKTEETKGQKYYYGWP